MGQSGQQDVKPILEINPSHAIIIKLKDMKKSKSFDNISQLLLDQAVLLEGAKLQNPTDFVDRLNILKEHLTALNDVEVKIMNYGEELVL